MLQWDEIEVVRLISRKHGRWLFVRLSESGLQAHPRFFRTPANIFEHPEMRLGEIPIEVDLLSMTAEQLARLIQRRLDERRRDPSA